MATSPSGLLAERGPGRWGRWVLTCCVVLLLLPPWLNLVTRLSGMVVSEVCGKPWWPDNSEEIRHWPWEVSLRIEDEHVCGGSLIDFSWVVSAAHCIQGTKEYTVMLGTTKLRPRSSAGVVLIPVSDIILHPKYWGRTFIKNDIALLHLQIPVTFSKYVQPICLPEPGLNLKIGTQCWVTGWSQVKKHSSANSTLTPELKETEVFIIDNRMCGRMYHKKPLYPRIVPLVQENMICATNYGENLCYGDSGGPLACEVEGRWILAGVLSWEKACARPQNPGVYSRLTKYTTWIKRQVSHGTSSGPRSSPWLPFLAWLLQLPVGQ